jgi:hypothetical protein
MLRLLPLAVLLLLVVMACTGEGTSGSDTGSSAADAEVTEKDLAEPAPEVVEIVETEEETSPPGPLLIERAELPTSPIGAPVAVTLIAAGGAPPYAWRLVRGELPPGLALEAASGEIAGTPTQEGVFLFVVGVTDSEDQEALELFGLRAGDPATEGPMRARARAYQEAYEARHLWHGMSYGNQTPDDPDGDYQLSTLGDATFVSGQCTQAMAFRHAAEPSPEALAVVTEQLEGWRFFQRLTGVPGLIGRSFFKLDDPVEHHVKAEFDDPDKPGMWIRGEGEFEGWIWRADTSRDQVGGAVLGIATAFDVVDDEAVRAHAAEFMTELVDHIWAHDLQLVDPDGEPTQYGDISGERLEHFPLPNGQAASCALAWAKIAHHMTGEARFSEIYDELMFDRDYLTILQDHQWVYWGYDTKWYNTYISWESFYDLMRLEDDPALRPQLVEIFRDTLWLNADDITPNRRGYLEWNANKTPWYLFSTGARDPERLYEATWQVAVFPEAPLRDRAIYNSQDPDIEKNPDKPDEAMTALPSYLRSPDMVIWHRSPYQLDSSEDDGEERTGCDYMQPYWMGRYYGYIQADW